jgi:hypothetical protein
MKNKYIRSRLDNDTGDPFEKIKLLRKKKPFEKNSYLDGKKKRVIYDSQNFKCRQCGFFVTANRELSGVNNRNHCPRCLWSRHMDLNTPGDRRADCQSRMEPIGLTCKQNQKRFGQNDIGELMLIHLCTGCGKISINRIAADDDIEAIQSLYMDSWMLSQELKHQLAREGIQLLESGDLPMVNVQLFGRGYEIDGNLEAKESCPKLDPAVEEC